jgi:hypothetical protein
VLFTTFTTTPKSGAIQHDLTPTVGIQKLAISVKILADIHSSHCSHMYITTPFTEYFIHVSIAYAEKSEREKNKGDRGGKGNVTKRQKYPPPPRFM